MGRAGSGLWNTARSTNVKHRPINIATKQAITVFQSPRMDAFPTRIL